MQKAKRLSEVSYFGIGGPADYFLTAHSVDDLKKAAKAGKVRKLTGFGEKR